MGPPRRRLQETLDDTINPPNVLDNGQLIALVIGAAGKNLYNVELATAEKLLVELEAKFRSTIWLKRGGFVVVDRTTLADRENKIDGEIVNVVRDEKRWRKTPYWPREFVKKIATVDDEDEESTIGKMPPSDSDGD